MDAAVMEIGAASAQQRLDTDRLRDMLLLRLAVSERALPRDAIARDLAPFTAHVLAADAWRAALDRDLSALAEAGLADLRPTSAAATEAGVRRAAIMFSGRAPFPKSWPEARDIRLVARALGIENEPVARLKALAKPEGLRAAILVKSFGLKLRGTPSPVKLRAALAKVALARAFGSAVDAPQGRSGLSAKAGRALAGRLASSPRDFKTDGRLVTALAADQVSAEGTDIGALQLALLRRFLTIGSAETKPAAKARRRAVVKARPRPVPQQSEAVAPAHAEATPTIMPVAQSVAVPHVPPSTAAPGKALPQPGVALRPSLQAFAADVLALAEPVAEGFVGNRKAFISRVWSTIATARPHWGLSDVEFKCMLTEAHRLGALTLANADLKDGRRLADIQASAVSYRNAIFHYVRIDT